MKFKQKFPTGLIITSIYIHIAHKTFLMMSWYLIYYREYQSQQNELTKIYVFFKREKRLEFKIRIFFHDSYNLSLIYNVLKEFERFCLVYWYSMVVQSCQSVIFTSIFWIFLWFCPNNVWFCTKFSSTVRYSFFLCILLKLSKAALS